MRVFIFEEPMIRTKDIGNAFAPAYRQNVAVDDAYVPCDAPGRGVETYVPAWGFLEQARSLAILDRWALKHRCVVPSPFPLSTGTWMLLSRLGDFPGADAATCRKLAADAATAADPTLSEGLYP